MKRREFLSVLLTLMLLVCLPGNAFADVFQTVKVKAGFGEGQQHVTVNENVNVNISKDENEVNAVYVEAHAPEGAADKNASAIIKGNVTLTASNAISVVYVEGSNGDASAEISGDISGTSGGEVNGIETWGHSYYGNGEANVTAGGNVSAESTAANATGIDSDQATVMVTGNVTAKGMQVKGVESYCDNTLAVGGNVSSEGERSTGIYAYSGKKTVIDVKGGILSKGSYAEGLKIESSGSGDLSLTVGKGIQAVSAETDQEAWCGADGISFYNGGGKLVADINGDVEAKEANGGAIGIKTDHSCGETGDRFEDGSSEVLVHGNVISDGIGVALNTFGEDTDVNVLVEDEIRAKKVGVAIGRTWFAEDSNKTEPKLTAWKIDLNDNGNAVEWADLGFDTIEDDEAGQQYKANAIENFEKHIMYIMKVEQPAAGGTLQAVDEDGNALAKSYDLDVAHEGDKVVLKADLAEGYKLIAAYNNDGSEKQPLSKDENGNYYLIVPKGGGICLTVDLEKKADANPAAKTDANPAAKTDADPAGKTAAIPAAKTGLIYNGAEQTGVEEGTGYTLTGSKAATDAGSYTATATLKDGYLWSDGTKAAKTVKWEISRAANPLKIKAKTATVKSADVKKKAKTLKVSQVMKFTGKGQGKLTYIKKSGDKKISINKKTGKVTVKKGLDKGTYKVKVKVKAAGNKNYAASKVKTVTFKITVK